ncbi:TetR/AcrR family transcriptional regulator [Streptomyces sp. NPDC055966]|uniref:TetR/AcrR family transcriptional regulator n=1 Tax=unclassified Streptomyces TaxID=2593676 RepID=UPI0035DC1F63
MARPRSDERRNTILVAATRVIASQGLTAASTATIAKEAGVSNGSLFVYFDTKSTLLNELYVSLKTEMAQAAFGDEPSAEQPVREQLRLIWTRWLHWATSHPDRRRALARLEVSDDITAESHEIVDAANRPVAELLERSRRDGPMADVPLPFVLTLIGAIADSTMDALIRDPDGPADRGHLAFEAVWRVLAG